MRLFFCIAFFLFTFWPGIGQEVQTGKASFYAHKFSGKLTANGERFNPEKFTAAHRKLPFGTRVRVTNLANNKSIVVRINDRGPYARGRIIDLSYATAKKLAFIKKGVTDVALKVVDEKTPITGKLLKKEKTTPSTKLDIPKDSIEKDSAIVKETEFYALRSKRSKPKGYGVQIGSYQKEANIIRLSNSLRNIYDQKVIVEIKVVEDTKIYSLILGDFFKKKNVKTFLKKVRKNYPDAFIINFKETEPEE